MGIEQRQLLLAVHHIDRVIDVERDGGRRAPVAAAPQVDHGVTQPDQGAHVGCILPARDGGLRGKIVIALRQPPAGQLERRVAAQCIEIVGVRVTAGDGEDACA